MCNQEKLEICKAHLKASVQNSLQNFLAKIVPSAFYCYWHSKDLKIVENQWLEVGHNVDLVWWKKSIKAVRQRTQAVGV